MEEFSQDIKIEVDIADIASIRDGLHGYANLLTNDGAFKGTRSKLLNVEFVHAKGDVRSLQLTDSPQLPLLQDVFSIAENGYIKIGTVIDENSFYHVSESILCSIALDKPELKDDVVNLALEMVAYSRRHNNTLDMWVDDVQVFALESLYMLARIYPEYTYLLGAFLIPNWDEDKAPYAIQYLTNLLRRNGWNRDLIKAYLYCDNYVFRQRICLEWDEPIYESLGSHFNNNHDDYNYFKAGMLERFKDQYYLPDVHVENIVYGFYETLDVTTEKTDAPLFFSAELHSDVVELQESIENELGSLLIFSEDSDDLEVSTCLSDDALETVRAFFHDGFSQGVKIWDYIDSGEPVSILRRIHPVDFLVQAESEQLAINEWFSRVDCSIEDANEHLLKLFSPYFTLLLGDFDEVGDSFVKQQQMLRFLDVLKCLMGVDALDISIKKLIVNKYNIIAAEDYSLRFNMPSLLSKHEVRQRLAIEITKLAEYFSEDYWEDIGFAELTRLSQLALQDRRSLLDVDWKKGKKGFYCLAAYILKQDIANEYRDQVTYKLIDVLKDGLFDPVVSFVHKNIAIESGSNEGMTEKQYFIVRDYISGKRFQGRTESEGYKIVLTLMKRYLVTTNDAISSSQPRYKLFESGDMQSIVLVAYLVLSGESKNGIVGFFKPYIRTSLSDILKNRIELKQNLHRILKLFVDLAPQKVIHQISYIRESFDIYENTAEDEVYFTQLEKLNIKRPDLLAYQVSLSQTTNGPGYRYLLHQFHYIDSDSTLNKAARRKARDLADGLQRSPEAVRIQFYHDMTKRYPTFGFRCMNEFYLFFEKFVNEKIDLTCESDFLADLKKNIISYVKGDLELDLIKSLFTGINLLNPENTDWTFRMALYFWKVDEPVRHRLATVLSNIGIESYFVAQRFYQQDVDQGCMLEDSQDAVLDYFYDLKSPMKYFSEYCMVIENHKYIQLFMTDEKLLDGLSLPEAASI